jgi:hypothetical protein
MTSSYSSSSHKRRSSPSREFPPSKRCSVFDDPAEPDFSPPAPLTHIPFPPAISSTANIFSKLSARSTNYLGSRQFVRRSLPTKFSRFGLNSVADTYDVEASKSFELQFLQKRSKIVEINSAQDVLFALTQSGICAAFTRQDFRRLCFLNVADDEVIRSLFYNKMNQQLITVSVFKRDGFSSLKCRTTPLEAIKQGKPCQGEKLFEAEALNWPGFVEFDDVNKLVLTYSAFDKVYKVWNLEDYRLLYLLQDAEIEEIKISPGIMLCVYKREPGHIPLKILNIHTGKEIRSLKHLLHRGKRLDFIEQFNEKLLVKQNGENLQILDIITNEIIEIDQSIFPTPTAFIFLYERHLFLTFLNHKIYVWNFQGELHTKFFDHQLLYDDCNTNNIFINPDQEFIISYCRDASEDGNNSISSRGKETLGSINISNILNGKLIGKITKNEEMHVPAVREPRAWRMTNLLARMPGQRHLVSQDESSEDEEDGIEELADETEDEEAENSILLTTPNRRRSNQTNSPGHSSHPSSAVSSSSSSSFSLSPLSSPQSGRRSTAEIEAERVEMSKARQAESDKREALKDITALFYSEETNEIYTGNKHGMLHVWSN